MKKRVLIISLSIVIFLTAYLFAVHYIIYQRIGAAGLKACDARHEYLLRSVQNTETNIVYTALGDSLTAGVGVAEYEESYPYKIAQKLSVAANVDLYVQAYPGARTSDVIKDLLTPAISNQPDIVTLLIGTNDIHGNVSKEKFSKNYAEILKRLKTETKAKIYVISIPHIGTDSLLLPPYNFYFRRQVVEFNKIIKKLAQENGVEYIDLYAPAVRMFENPSLYSTDYFHPSAKGYELWSDIIYANFNK